MSIRLHIGYKMCRRIMHTVTQSATYLNIRFKTSLAQCRSGGGVMAENGNTQTHRIGGCSIKTTYV